MRALADASPLRLSQLALASPFSLTLPRRGRGLILLLALAFSALACDRNKPAKDPYYGPTLPLAQLVDQINQRNTRIDSIRAEGSFSAKLIDPQTKKQTGGDGDAVVLFMPQKNLRLVGRVLGTRIFEIGSNEDRYWMIVYDKTDTMWWGNHRLIDAKGAGLLPVRPDLLSEVLCVGAINPDLLKDPSPVLRFNNDQDCYMLTWQVMLSDRWAVQKEVWYDRQTLLPKLVLLFDGNGRIVLRAYLSKHAPVEGYDPTLQIASEYAMFFPDTGSTFSVTLKDLKRKSGNVPTLRSFNFPGETADVSKVIQVDE